METQARYVLVGLFTLAAVVGAFIFIAVFGKIQFDRAYAYYDIVFEDAVSGLSIEGEVRYNGILVGEVKRIWIRPETPDKVWVRVRIERRDDIVIREDAVASLEFQGVTGVSFIQISGGTVQAAVLPTVSDPNGDAPVITAERSALQAVFASVPSMLAQAERLLISAQELFSDDNQQRFGDILENVRVLTEAVAGEEESIATLIADVAEIAATLNEASAELSGLTGELRSVVASADGVMSDEVPAFLDRAAMTAEAYEILANDVSRLIRENEEAVATFTNQGLSQLAFFLTEARLLVATIDRIAQRVESDAPGFIFGVSSTAEIEAGGDR